MSLILAKQFYLSRSSLSLIKSSSSNSFLLSRICGSSKCLSLKRLISFNFGAEKSKNAEEEKPKEVEFTKSPAYVGWKSTYNFFTDPDDIFTRNRPKSQRKVIIASLTAFLVYFCMLREENDIDEILYQPLIKTIPELEKPLIITAIYDHHMMGLPTKQLRDRLKEINEQEETNK